MNQLRAFLLERGIVVRQGPEFLRDYLPTFFGDTGAALSGCMRTTLLELWHEWEELEGRIARANETMTAMVADHEACRRLQSIPGIGIVTATAIVAAIGNGAAFRKGRDFAAWLGLVPKQFSTGGNRDFSVLASAAILIYGNSSSMAVELCSHVQNATGITSALGLTS